MSSSRARTRFAVVAATVPLIAAGGVLVSPASAATATVAPYQSIGYDNTVGPNAGFRNPAQGVRGNTAVLKIDVDSKTTSLDRVDLRLSGYSTGPALVPDRDFAQTDGFAVYKDVSKVGDGLGDADGVFDATDFAQGPVSTGYVLSSPTASEIPVRITMDGVRATGSTRYFVTVHPGSSAGSTENREFKLKLPENGIKFGDSTTGPAAAVETPKLTIDSKPPIAPNRVNFSPRPQPALERQGATKVEDAYFVSASEANDEDKTLLFLNDGNNTAPSNFLYRADGTPAIAKPPTVSSPLFIGDGTGITATVKVARNNQLGDDVYVRSFDTLGNLSVAARLFDNSAATSGDNVDRANDVTAPAVSGTSVGLRNTRGINLANQAAVLTRATFSAPSASTSNGTHSRAAAVEARFVKTVGGIESTDPADATPWGRGAPNATSTASQNIDFTVNATGVGVTGNLFRVQARLVDLDGNMTDYWKSTSVYPKDLITPQLTGVSFEHDEDGDGAGDPGDAIRVRWSEGMFKGSIEETNETTPCLPTADEEEAPQSCVIERLEFPDSPNTVTWGADPIVEWSPDLTSVLVTLGTPPSPTMRLPKQGDKVRSNGKVQDPAGNAAAVPDHSDRFIAAPPPIPVYGNVTTADTVGRNLFNQGRDGILDKITVVFPGTATKVAENLGQFQIVGSEVLTPSAVTGSGTSYTFSFGGTMGTGETPKVVYTPPANADTGVKVGSVTVPPFTTAAIDTAPPALQSLTTADTNANGKLDTMIAKYSEEIEFPLTFEPGDFRVHGYETGPNSTTCPATGIPNVMSAYNLGSEGDSPNVVNIEMCEKAAPDTAATPTATAGFRASDLAVDADGDPAANTSPNGWSSGDNATGPVFNRVLDKAPPVVMSRTTRDLNSDGRIDAIDIVTSETLDAFSIANGAFIVTGRTISSLDILGSTGVRINIVPIAPGLTGDTDAKPAVQYTGGVNGGITDASDQRNPMRPETTATAAADGAGPAITGSCYGTGAATNNGKCPTDATTDDKMNVFFSEAVTDLQNTDFAVEQPAGSNKATTAVAAAADAKSATLTLANNTFDQLKDATIRFTGAGAVKDASNPAQGNTQTATITAPAPPAVKMNLTCPIPASPGYCGANSVNTGATTVAGMVRNWRLATTPRATTTPDSEYSTTVPSIYPPAGQILPEGKLTLFLSGKDDYGRLSTEVTQTIEILKAPVLKDIKFSNGSTGPTSGWAKTDTMMDGDSVRAEGTVESSDVGSWASSTGTCLGNHMSVDYRGITGITSGTTNSAVAPTSCKLNTATAPDSRRMEFPYVKATGTTKFPVGTAIRLNANDPGAIIVDGPNGTQVRRHFISVNARRSHQIPDAHVITVPSALMNGIPRGSGMGYRDGSVVKTSTSGYYYMYQNIKRPISGATLKAWSIPTTSVYVVSPAELNAHGTGVGLAGGAHPLGSWIKFSNGSVSYITKNAQGVVVRRGITALAVLTSHVPGSQVYKATSQDAAIPFDGSYLRGLRDGSLLKMGSNPDSYAIVSRTALRRFANTRTLYSMGFNPANARAFSSTLIGRPVTGTYSEGTPIDRYKITSLVIKVTNKAGAVVTGVVTPQGIYGVGTHEPIPANWDASRA